MTFKDTWIAECEERRKKGSTKRFVKSCTLLLFYWLSSIAVAYTHFTDCRNEAVCRIVSFVVVAVVLWLLYAATIAFLTWIAVATSITRAEKLITAPHTTSQRESEHTSKETHGLLGSMCCLKVGCFNGVNNTVHTLSEIAFTLCLVAVDWTWLAALFLSSFMLAELSLAGIALGRDKYFKLLDDDTYTALFSIDNPPEK